jgi:hypothetical protein
MQAPTVFVPKDVLSHLSDPEWFKKFVVGL